ncbi:hypothetical protein M6B38_213345 [Iris pallida]|uniref:Uncharacterized protein n=1 Tax=Iris pallida TaxID=29817 RepID=A0AAX6E246_IRIPA|nr:hypothetical protein M6B38_213345 [Iris pallida]
MATRLSPEALVTLSSCSSPSLQRLVMTIGGGSRLSVGRRETMWTVEREDVEGECGERMDDVDTVLSVCKYL